MKTLSIWLKIAVGVALSLCVVAIFQYMSRPTILPQLVGTWKGQGNPKDTYIFRKDGTYDVTSFDANVRGHRDIEFKSSGTWLYRPNEIIFNRVQFQAFQNGKPFPKILELVDPVEKRSGGMPIRWLDKKRWAPTEVGMGHFYKIGA